MSRKSCTSCTYFIKRKTEKDCFLIFFWFRNVENIRVIHYVKKYYSSLIGYDINETYIHATWFES